MPVDHETPLKDMIYLSFLELPCKKFANQLYLYLLKCKVKYNSNSENNSL